MGRINVTQSSMPSLEEYVEALRPVWESRWLSNRGEASKKYEDDLKKYLGCDNVWLFANGHVALEVALQALKLNKEFPDRSKGGGGLSLPPIHMYPRRTPLSETGLSQCLWM